MAKDSEKDEWKTKARLIEELNSTRELLKKYRRRETLWRRYVSFLVPKPDLPYFMQEHVESYKNDLEL